MATHQPTSLKSNEVLFALTGGGRHIGPPLSTTSLSAREIAMLADIQNRGRGEQSVRTGKISLAELMGAGDKDRPQENVPPAACSRSPTPPSQLRPPPPSLIPPPGFPPLPPFFPNLGNVRGGAPGHCGFPMPPMFPPQIVAAAMAAAAAAQAAAARSGSPPGGGILMPPPLLPPHLLSMLPPLSPMFPLATGTTGAGVTGSGGGMTSASGFTKAQSSNNRSSNMPQSSTSTPLLHSVHSSGGQRASSAAATSSTGQMQQQTKPSPIQKTRKPFFMPYLNNDVVARGIKNRDFIKGTLRINQRNYEEAYVDNPEGNDQVDILILGIHDRNRALHGDVVVVRVKDRSHWIVRDAMYQAWRTGHLNMSRDENGQPLTIPPVAAAEDSSAALTVQEHFFEPQLLATMKSVKKWKRKVNVSSSGCYDRDDLLRIGAQMDYAMWMNQQRHQSSSPGFALAAAAEEAINRLAIANRRDVRTLTSPTMGSSDGHVAVSSQASSVRGSGGRRSSVHQNSAQRRLNYRLLCDMPDEDWGIPDVCLQKTAEVVCIAEQKNCRAAVGQMKVMTDGNRNWALFSPNDSRMPRMMIPADQLPHGFFDRPQDFAKFIYVARIVEWQATAQFARGKLYKSLGMAGDIEAETEGLLMANDIDTREYSQAAISSLPISDSTAWTIDEKEFKYRRDFRGETVFTIDPMTARDLDDALHVRRLADDSGWEVGVHIADVTHFVLPGTELDNWAAQRATSTYLVHKVIPMLPRILCEELCSLKSGVDRLTFSVVWHMNDAAEVVDEWFGRSIIRSACKMAYEHAQDMIEHPDKEFATHELPMIHDSRTPQDLQRAVLQLHRLATLLHARRMEHGALRIEQPKLKFALNDENGMPNAVSIYQRKDANSLVEEFMLMANMAVARHIEAAFPQTALLRRHPPPKQKVLREVLEQCEKIGFPMNGTSSATLAHALARFEGDDELQTAVGRVLSHLLLKPMQLAVYFCTGTMQSQADYHHYALNVPFYTHFTSPIRRYADVMVHRLLAAALGYSPPPTLTPKQVEAHAIRCNEKKYAAKMVGEASEDMFFGVFIKECGPLEERGVVIQVLDAAFDVLIVRYGVVKRVYTNRLRLTRDPFFEEGPPASLTLYWDPAVVAAAAGKGDHGSDGRSSTPPASAVSNAVVEQTIEMCAIVNCVLSAAPEPTKYMCVIKPTPNDRAESLASAIAKAANKE